MALKKSDYVRESQLVADNEARLVAAKGTPEAKLAMTTWALFLASCLDAIASGERTHINIGQPRNKKSFLVSVYSDQQVVERVGGADFVDLADRIAAEILDSATGGGGEVK